MFDYAQIREYRAGDVPAMKRLWRDCFGDGEELTAPFFEHLCGMGTGFAAVRDDKLIGMAFVLFAELRSADLKRKDKISYIYAVAVEKTHRCHGIGEALTRECVRYSRERGAESVCTLPASEKLYEWYEAVGNMHFVSCCEYENTAASDEPAEIIELEADEYGWRRDDLLTGVPYVHFLYSFLQFWEALCRVCGGGLFACGDGIACGYVEDGVLYIKEAINDPPEFIPALCRKLGAAKAVVRRPSDDAEPFVCSDNPLPGGTVWNIALD